MATKKKPPPKSRAMSLHLGLNSVNPQHYGGWSGDLSACEFDALDMAAIAKVRGMKPTVLLTKSATRAKVLAAVRDAAKKLAAGDLFFLTYSGHGGQMPDITGDEPDKQDETWCLFDGEVIDDELYVELGAFKPGVRVLVLSDSCHSGSVVRAGPPRGDAAATSGRPKRMPPSVALRTYTAHKAFYDRLQKDVAARAGRSATPKADTAAAASVSPRLTAIANGFAPAVILISGCQDNQLSMDGEHNGAFTERLLLVWNNGSFDGNYARFHSVIKAGMPDTQTPNLFTLGNTAKFVTQAPFTV